MQLALTVLLAVLGVTAIAAAAGYLIDRSARREEGHSGTVRKTNAE